MKKLFIILSILFLTSCSYHIAKPSLMNLNFDKDTSSFHYNALKSNVFVYQINSLVLKMCYINFLPDNFVFFGYDGLIGDYSTIGNNDSIVRSFFNKESDDNKYTYKNKERWGFYNLRNDSIFIQYFSYVGQMLPSVRVAEFQGRVLSDSLIVFDKHTINFPHSITNFELQETVFNPPIVFKRFEIDHKPDYKRSWIKKTLWYKKFLKSK